MEDLRWLGIAWEEGGAQSRHLASTVHGVELGCTLGYPLI